MTNYYQILNVNKNDDQDKIKKAYRKLQFKYHPDRGGNEEMFIKINEAYDILSNPEKKNIYDNQNNEVNNQHMSVLNNDLFKKMFNNSENIGNLENIFNMPNNLNISNIFDILNQNENKFNKNNKNKNKNKKPSPIIKNIRISLEEAYFGIKYPLIIERWYMDNELRVKENINIYINIYPGIDDNELIILKEKGNIIDEKNKGDVKIFVNIENNTEFKRKGLDLIYKKNITLKEALIGFSFNIRHLSGKTYNINNTNGELININYKKK